MKRRSIALIVVPGLAAVVALMAMRAHAQPKPAQPPAESTREPSITGADARDVLFGTATTACVSPSAADAATAFDDNRRFVRCMLTERYAAKPKDRDAFVAMYNDTGDVFAPGQADTMDGGYRGIIKLVPVEPNGDAKHLRWVIAALRDYDDFFTQLADKTRTDILSDDRPPPTPYAFRWRALMVRFVRSEKKRTPAAYALPWTVTYNIAGSLHRSGDVVRETLFHEIFHMNDFTHGTWTAKTLRTDYDAIVAKCSKAKDRTKCFAPYAPGTTKVIGGTYYAFTANNGDSVNEYGAELALRYYVEQREMLKRGKLRGKAFKCGPVENARAWEALVKEFFVGRDLVPACK
jgi:hypothetical protein